MVKPRDISDRAYVEAHRDELLKHYIAVGHSKAWISVLMGERPGILLPRLQVDRDELTKLRDLVKQYFILEAPEAVFPDEIARWLSDDQLHALSAGKPILFTQLVERHLRPAEPRANTNLVSRYRNSEEFGIAQSLFYIGLLTHGDPKNVTEEGAVDSAIAKIREKRPFAGWLRGHPVNYLKNRHKDGKRADRIRNYYGGKNVNEEVRRRVREARRSEAARIAELRFWLTVLSAVLKTSPQPDQQVVSHNILSRAARALLEFPRREWLNFRGDRRGAVDEVDLLALAYLDLPDVARIFPNKAVSAPRFRASAALGRLSRGCLARLTAEDRIQLVELGNPAHHASPSGYHVSASLPPPMTADEFLLHAKRQTADDLWWLQALAQPFDQELAVHLRRDVPLLVPDLGEDAAFNGAEAEFQDDPLFRILAQFLAEHGYTLKDGTFHTGYLYGIRQIDGDRLAILDVRAHRRFGAQQNYRLVESLVALAATCTRANIGPGQLQAEDKSKPGFWREQVRIAVALKTVLAKRQPEILERLDTNIESYNSALTDLERDVCYSAGEFTGALIGEFVRQRSTSAPC